jgi:hypothetical protein
MAGRQIHRYARESNSDSRDQTTSVHNHIGINEKIAATGGERPYETMESLDSLPSDGGLNCRLYER